jgi:hypothetical protein
MLFSGKGEMVLILLKAVPFRKLLVENGHDALHKLGHRLHISTYMGTVISLPLELPPFIEISLE